MRTNFNRNLLWTIGVTDTTYKNQFVFSNIVIHTELIKGLNRFAETKNDLELNIRSQLQLADDTLQIKRDLKRAIFSFEPGINLALKTRHYPKRAGLSSSSVAPIIIISASCMLMKSATGFSLMVRCDKDPE